MNPVRTCLLLLFLGLSAAPDGLADETQTLSVMTWNIWHGGREDGEQVGPRKVIEVIRDSGVDIVAMQETYGSGEQISEALQFKFHPRGTNLSIHSRWPVVEDLSVFEPFKCVGALIELPDGRRVAFFSIWLPYHADIWIAGQRDTGDPQAMIEACQASCDDLQQIKQAIDQRLSGPDYADVPVIIAGDFNSMSHLDYISSTADQYGTVIDWPTSHVLLDDGFRDAWRETHPEVDRARDRTWSPRFSDQEQDRIDFVYYRGSGLQAIDTEMIDTHAAGFPSDHAAVVARFEWAGAEATARQLRTVSYNIKHGRGMDNRVDLARTAALLSNLRPDIVGLQEVDNRARRSGMVDQAATLGDELGMHAAFGKFMDFQGGQYGMAVLSRFPIEEQVEIPLPEGHEPRIALACRIHPPGGRPLWVVNVHFDWVADDAFRFAQASTLARHLATLDAPWILLGDFNDVPESRTLDLLSRDALPASKPAADSFTFSSTEPRREIDFVFAAPRSAWQLRGCRVLDAPRTSDHRPVLAVLEATDHSTEDATGDSSDD